MLITSFDIMRDGMDYEDYNTFRNTLTPASGFQSAQFRYLELYCTPLINLINEEGKKRLPKNPSTEDYFEHIYWKDAGLNRNTGKKSLTLIEFEKRYLNKFIDMAKKVEGQTIEDKVLTIAPLSNDFKETLKTFDKLYNVDWPLVHLKTAEHYLNSKGEDVWSFTSVSSEIPAPQIPTTKIFPVAMVKGRERKLGPVNLVV